MVDLGKVSTMGILIALILRIIKAVFLGFVIFMILALVAMAYVYQKYYVPEMSTVVVHTEYAIVDKAVEEVTNKEVLVDYQNIWYYNQLEKIKKLVVNERPKSLVYEDFRNDYTAALNIPNNRNEEVEEVVKNTFEIIWKDAGGL